jgi:hypothetical protein
MGTSRIRVLVTLTVFFFMAACGGGGDEPKDVSASDEGVTLDEGNTPDVPADTGEDVIADADVSEEIDEGPIPADCAVDNGGCDSNASCEMDAEGTIFCTCEPGWDGDGFDCADIDECAGENGCDPNASCENSDGSYTCACPEGFEGDGLSCADIDECLGDHGCGENGSCNNEPGGFSCSCNEGFEGDGLTCTDLDECATEVGDCGENAQCTNTSGGFECACDTGFDGDGLSCTDIDECADTENPFCLGTATCENAFGSYECLCDPGYVYDAGMEDCVDLDECTSPEVPSCDPNATCTNSDGAFSCDCSAGFIGVGYDCAVDPDNCGCFNVNECDAGLDGCDENATCADTPGAYECTCNTGFEGDGMACTDVDECQTGAHDCALVAVCTNTVGGFSCSSLCDNYCEKVAENCTGANTIDFLGADCWENCALWPEGFLGATTGNNVYCRLLYGGALAVSDPDGNCGYAAPDGGGLCVDNGGACSSPKPLGPSGVATMFGNAPAIVQTLGSCDTDTSPGYGAWFQYLVTESGSYMITATNETETLSHSRMTLYQGIGCGAEAQEVECSIAPDKEVSTVVDLEANTVYMVHFYSDGPTFTMVNPTVSIQPYEASTTGQNCANAEDISDATFPLQLNGSFTLDGVGGTCDPTATNGVWFTYTASATDNYKLSVNNQDSSAWGRVAVYQSEGCESLASTEMQCTEFTAAGGEIPLSLEAGQTYKIHFYTDGESYAMTNPSISIEPVVLVTGGDTCDAAADLTSATLPVEMIGFFTDDPIVTKSCGELTAYNAVWFTYTPLFSGDYVIELTNVFSLAYGRVAVFDGGGCTPLGTEVACETADDPAVNVTVTLSADQAYVILFHTDGDDWSMQNPAIDIYPAP